MIDNARDDRRGRTGRRRSRQHRLPGSPRLALRGSIAARRAAGRRDVSVDNPTQFFVNALRAALIANGIDVRGPAVDIDDIRDAPAPPDGAPIDQPSVAAAVDAGGAADEDQPEPVRGNVAEDAGRRRAGRVPTAAAGRSAPAALERWGVGPDGLIQRDGSGLSRYDYVTPEALVTILTHVDRDRPR